MARTPTKSLPTADEAAIALHPGRPPAVRITWRDARLVNNPTEQFTQRELQADQHPGQMVAAGLLVCECKESVTIALQEILTNTPSEFRNILTIPRENITSMHHLRLK